MASRLDRCDNDFPVRYGHGRHAHELKLLDRQHLLETLVRLRAKPRRSFFRSLRVDVARSNDLDCGKSLECLQVECSLASTPDHADAHARPSSARRGSPVGGTRAMIA